ncbi:PucR family transcriptional regulator [Nonomuraea sp. NPDC050394]|uniref:PucR family transcriptional regulator n=1 Tax=Nonomuraea sp. NPDC050394 TaxID=3364363 RepID=UPI0037A5C7CC
MSDAREAPVTVGQVLAMGLLPVHETLGGQNALLRQVEVVVPGTTPRAIGTLRAGSLVVFDRSQLAAEDVTIDLAIRSGYGARIAGIVAQRAQRSIPLVTRRLAERFEMPVVLLDHVEVGDVVAMLERHVRAPAALGAELLGTAITAMSSPPRDTAELIRRLGDALRCPTALIDAEGHVITGDLGRITDELRTRVKDLAASPTASTASTARDSGEVDLIQLATLSASASRNLWLVARLPAVSSAHLVEASGRALAVAAMAFTAYLAERSLHVERESRQRTLLLTEILEQPEAPRRLTVERATALGWRLSGWHTAVHVSLRTPTPATRGLGGIAALIEDALAAQSITTALVERPTGWALWTTGEAPPTTDETAALARLVRRALLVVEREEPQLRPCAGVGGAYQGTDGIGRSLQEAEQACLLARTHDTSAPVEHVATASAKRLLLAWYSSGRLADIISGLLGPLREVDPDGELIHTLRVYLDHESSATTTAAVLGVHRNTVINRLDRIRQILPVDLTEPHERLAVHLAAHTMNR